MPAAVARLMMALKLASLAQGASGVRPETRATCSQPMLDARPDAGGAVPGLGRRVGRSRAARAHVGGDDRRRRVASSTAQGAGRRGAGARRPDAARARRQGRPRAAQRHAVLDRLCAGRAVRDRDAVPARRWSTGALSTDAARGSDAPFDPRIHALRRHRGQIEAADALRALMAGSAIRASHLIGDERVQDPVLPALPAAGDGRRARPAAPGRGDAGDRSQRRHRQSADLRRHRRGACPAAISTPSRSPSPPTCIALAICEIGSLAERRIAMLVDPALSGLPAFLTPKPGPQFRLHDPAGHGGGAGLGEQAARPSGQRRHDPDLGQPGRPRLDGGARRAPAAADGRESPRRSSASSCWPRRRAATSIARCARARRSSAVRALRAPRTCRIWTTTAIFAARHRSAPPTWSRSRRARRPRPARYPAVLSDRRPA